MASTKEYHDFIMEQLLRLENVDDRQFLTILLNTVAEELPEIKKKR